MRRARRCRILFTALSLAYRLLYRIGLTPWEQMATHAVAQQIATMFEREEAGREPPYGPVLDLGCGSGIWATRLAKRGWQVTGVDNVPKALRRAHERAAAERVTVRLVDGDVTALEPSDVGTGFQLLLDFGCFHDELSDEQRAAEGRGATTVAAPGATLLMLAWAPRRRVVLPRGASRADIEAAFPDWRVVDEEVIDPGRAPGWWRNAEPRFYRLRRE
jgi:SAM-dependent methyltransferase